MSTIQSSGTHIFWGEIAPSEHIARFYEHDGVLLDTLVGFIGGGLKAGEVLSSLPPRNTLKLLKKDWSRPASMWRLPDCKIIYYCRSRGSSRKIHGKTVAGR